MKRWGKLSLIFNVGLISALALFWEVPSLANPNSGEDENNQLLIQSALLSFELQRLLSQIRYPDLIGHSSTNASPQSNGSHDALETSLRQSQSKLQEFRLEVERTLVEGSLSIPQAAQAISLYFGNLTQYLTAYYEKHHEFAFPPDALASALKAPEEILNQLSLHGKPQLSPWKDRYYRFKRLDATHLQLSSESYEQIILESRIARPDERDFMLLVKRLLYREKMEAFFDLQSFLPDLKLPSPELHPELKQDLFQSLSPNLIKEDLDQAKDELHYRNQLSESLETLSFQTIEVWSGLETPLFEAISTSNLTVNQKTELTTALRTVEKEAFKTEVRALLKSNGELLHSLPLEQRKEELKEIVVQAKARTTRRYFEWLVAYFENEELIDSLQNGEIDPTHPNIQKAQLILKQLESDSLLNGVIRSEVFGLVSVWENLDVIEKLYEDQVALILQTASDEAIQEWIEKTQDQMKSQNRSQRILRWKGLREAAHRIHEKLQSGKIELSIFDEFVALRLSESHASIPTQVQQWQAQIAEAKTYSEARKVFLEIISEILDPTVVEGGYLRVERLLAIYHDLFTPKTITLSRYEESPLDRFLNHRFLDQESTAIWQLVQIATWYGFHLPENQVLNPGETSPDLNAILLSVADRYRYQALYRQAMINAYSTVYRILFVPVKIGEDSKPLHEVLVDLKKSQPNQDDRTSFETALPFLKKAALVVCGKIQKVFDLLHQANEPRDLVGVLSSSFISVQILQAFPGMESHLSKMKRQAQADSHPHQIAHRLHGPILLGVTADIGMRILNFIVLRSSGRALPLINWILNSRFYLNHIHRPLIQLFWLEIGLSGHHLLWEEKEQSEQRQLFFLSRAFGSGAFSGRQYWSLQEDYADRRFNFLAFQFGTLGVVLGVHQTFHWGQKIFGPLRVRKAYRFFGAEVGDVAAATKRFQAMQEDASLSRVFLKRAARNFSRILKSESQLLEALQKEGLR